MSAEFPRRDDHRPAFLRPKTPQKARSPSTPLPQEAPRKTPDAPAGRKPHADREGVGFCRLRQPGAFRPAPPQKKLRIARKGGFCRAPHRQGRAFPKKQRRRRNTHPCAARHAEKGEGRVLQRRARASRRGQTEETVFFTGNAGRSAPHGRPGKRLPAFPAIFPQPCLSKKQKERRPKHVLRRRARDCSGTDAAAAAQPLPLVLTGADRRRGFERRQYPSLLLTFLKPRAALPQSGVFLPQKAILGRQFPTLVFQTIQSLFQHKTAKTGRLFLRNAVVRTSRRRIRDVGRVPHGTVSRQEPFQTNSRFGTDF